MTGAADGSWTTKGQAEDCAAASIEEFDGDAAAEWDAYVVRAGLPMQLAGWQAVVRDTFGVTPRYLLARRGESGGLVGVLPVYLLQSALAGRVLRSMPGGMSADDPEAAAALVSAAETLARQARAARLELQDGRVAWPLMATSWRHAAWRVEVVGGAASCMERLHRNVRRQIRIAQGHGLAVRIDREGRDLDAFYELLRHAFHVQGTPIYGRDFLRRAWAGLPGLSSLLVARPDGKPLAGFLQLDLGRCVYGLWGGALPEGRELRAGYLAYWEIMRDAAERGFECLDMGRSPLGSGAAEFKGQWGGSQAPVYQQELCLDGSTSGGPAAPGARFSSLASWWARLPLAATSSLGPIIRRHIPFG